MGIPKVSDVESIAVMGFGTMGQTWATALLLGGLGVYVYEADANVVERNKQRVQGYLESLKKKGKWDGDVAATVSKIEVLEDDTARLFGGCSDGHQ